MSNGDVSKPWRVVSEEGGLLSNQDTEEQAKARCAAANEAAIALGIPATRSYRTQPRRGCW